MTTNKLHIDLQPRYVVDDVNKSDLVSRSHEDIFHQLADSCYFLNHEWVTEKLGEKLARHVFKLEHLVEFAR